MSLRENSCIEIESIDGEDGNPHTICRTLGHWLLPTAAANAHSVDDIALFGLVTQTASLVRSRGA